MLLKLYDTQQKKKVTFSPLHPERVGIYVCGVTVYDLCHIGHARTFVCFDVIIRYLKHLKYRPFFVRNITDVDDKIIHRAAELGCSCGELTAEMTKNMHEDFTRLNLLPPDVEPKATEHIAEMIACIETLLKVGAAYVASSKDVYFKRAACHDYGVLSGQNLSELIEEHRIQAQAKINPGDFVLWKVVTDPNEISWESPWGRGRPGWHIECSAMSKKWLGKTFDIHGGGGDLKFPHHENERAQSLCVNKAPFARHWMHTGMIQILDQKMSKSLKNFLTIREALEIEHPEVLRYFFLMAHYRSPLQYSAENLKLAKQSLYRLYNALYESEKQALKHPNSSFGQSISAHRNAFEEAMNDDFNVPQALPALFECANKIFKAVKERDFSLMHELTQELKFMGNLLGILNYRPLEILQHSNHPSAKKDREEIEALIAQRQEARRSKSWDRADHIRQQLLQDYGVIVEDDGPQTFWRYA